MWKSPSLTRTHLAGWPAASNMTSMPYFILISGPGRVERKCPHFSLRLSWLSGKDQFLLGPSLCNQSRLLLLSASRQTRNAVMSLSALMWEVHTKWVYSRWNKERVSVSRLEWCLKGKYINKRMKGSLCTWQENRGNVSSFIWETATIPGLEKLMTLILYLI